MQFGTPPPDDDTTTHRITAYCGCGLVWCEACSALDRPLQVVLRPSEFGTVCLVYCDLCATNAPTSYCRPSARAFAAEHREHLTRAADIADPRRGTR